MPLLPPAVFDAVARRFHSPELQREMRQLLAPAPGESVLDAASGTSQLFHLVTPAEYYGIDLDADRVRLAARRHPLARVAASDASRLALRDGRFDAVLASGLFHHVDDATAGRILEEFARVLKPGGRLVVLDAIWPTRWYNAVGFVGRLADDGRHVRWSEEYLRLFSRRFRVATLRFLNRWGLEAILVALARLEDAGADAGHSDTP